MTELRGVVWGFQRRCGVRVSRCLALCGLLTVALNCSGDATSPSAIPASRAFWTLALNQYAVNMAVAPPYNTFRLTATPLTVAGTPVVGDARTTFLASDSSVTVDPVTGLVTAHFATDQTLVSVSASVGGIGITETVMIRVTDVAPQAALATLSIQPSSGDSAKRSMDSTAGVSWRATVTNTAQQIICDSTGCPFVIRYTSSDSNVANIDTGGVLSARDTGRVVLTASTWAYGVARRDSVIFTIGNPLFQQVEFHNPNGQSPVNPIVLGTGGIISFWNAAPSPVSITFDDTTGIDAATSLTPFFAQIVPPSGRGNIPGFSGDTSTLAPCPNLVGLVGTCLIDSTDFRARRFRRAGRFHYVTNAYPSTTFEILVAK